MLVIGLTGGISSGKSTVAELFRQRGITIIDTDQIARNLTEPGQPALTAITEHFGKDVLNTDQSLNRKALRHQIFASEAERRWLESLLHPLIREEMKRQAAGATSPYCIIVIPLLTESTPDPIIQRILLVDTTRAGQMARTKKRDQVPASLVAAILKSQTPREKKLHLADDIIHNNSHPEALLAQVEKLHQFYLGLAHAIIKKNSG